MKKFTSNDNLLSLIQKEYNENIPLNTINPKNYIMNRNQTFYELNKLYDNQIKQNQGEEIKDKNYFNNKRNTDRCSKIIKKKYYQNKFYDIQYTENKEKSKINNNEKTISFAHLKNKCHSKKQKTKNHKNLVTYSLDSKKSINNQYNLGRVYKEDKEAKRELENYYSKGFQEKTYNILTNTTPNSVGNNNNVKNKKKINKLSENKYANNCHKKNAKLEYEKLFTYYNYDNNIGNINNIQNDKYNSLSNNFHFDKSPKLGHNNPNKVKNIKCTIQLNDYYNQNNNKIREFKGFEKENIYNNYINSYKNSNKYIDPNLNNEECGDGNKNLYSTYSNMKRFGGYEIQNNECFSENEVGNDIRKINSPMEYVSCYSTGSDDNNKKIQYYNQYNNNICQTEQSITLNDNKLNNENKLTYQLESPNKCIGFHSISDFHCVPKCLEIENIENFEIINKMHYIENFCLQILPDNVGKTICYPKINIHFQNH